MLHFLADCRDAHESRRARDTHSTRYAVERRDDSREKSLVTETFLIKRFARISLFMFINLFCLISNIYYKSAKVL